MTHLGRLKLAAHELAHGRQLFAERFGDFRGESVAAFCVEIQVILKLLHLLKTTHASCILQAVVFCSENSTNRLGLCTFSQLIVTNEILAKHRFVARLSQLVVTPNLLESFRVFERRPVCNQHKHRVTTASRCRKRKRSTHSVGLASPSTSSASGFDASLA